MKKTIIFFVSGVIIFAAGGLVGFYLAIRGIDFGFSAQPNEDRAAQEDATITREGFSITLPKGWKEVQPPAGVSLMAANSGEEIKDENLKKINFKSYYTVIYDNLQGRTLKEYVDYIKEMTTQYTPGLKFVSEEETAINDKEGYRLEAEVTQQGADFKVVILLVPGQNEDIWSLSMSTGVDDWEKKEEFFSDLAKTFKTE